MTEKIPKVKALDSSLAFLREGYRFVSNRCGNLHSDVFQARLLGKSFFVAQGEDAARTFYAPERFTRKGALPTSVLHLLQDKNSVATLDGKEHHHRKAMFMALMRSERLELVARLTSEELRNEASRVVGQEVSSHTIFRLALGRSVCRWAGLPVEGAERDRLIGQLGAMIDNAGRVGPPNWLARVQRWGAERKARRFVEAVREGSLVPPEGSALHDIALHRDQDGNLLPAGTAAIELLNILRPTVAVARFATFAMLALHQHPRARQRVASDDDYLQAFVQEVRRTTPFFPVVAGIVRQPFTWRGRSFVEGERFMLDLYGTNHDPRIWSAPEDFQPERFLGWGGNAFTLIPQGGGDHDQNHRCAGEWMTIALMETMLRTMTREIRFTAPKQNLTVDLSRMPALPKSGVMIRIEKVL